MEGRERDCRVIAEFLEPSVFFMNSGTVSDGGAYQATPQGEIIARDFYADECASAVLLEAMTMPRLWLQASNRYWICVPDASDDDTYGADPDRKTAIVKAMLAYIEQAAPSGRGGKAGE